MFTLKHAFASPQADGVDPTLVKPSDWNAEHPILSSIDGVYIGRPIGAGPGPMQEMQIGVLRVHSAAGWTWGTTTPIAFPFDTVDINSNIGAFAGGVWTPPQNSTWRVSVSIIGTIIGNAGACEMVMYDHTGSLQGAFNWDGNVIPVNFTIALFGSDIYQWGASPPNVQWSGAIGGSCTLQFSGQMAAERLG